MGTSLNYKLMQGPDLNNNLIGVLMRFREEKFTVIADIESMLNQARVDPRHRDSLHFLWWLNGELHSTPAEYKMTVHIFGVLCVGGRLQNAHIPTEVKHPVLLPKKTPCNGFDC